MQDFKARATTVLSTLLNCHKSKKKNVAVIPEYVTLVVLYERSRNFDELVDLLYNG